MRILLLLPLVLLMLNSCRKKCGCDDDTTFQSNLIIRVKFDSTMARLNNMGEPAVIIPGRAGQTPSIDSVSISYIELLPTENTPFGGGTIVYKAPETTAGGSSAVDLEKSLIVKKPDNMVENADIVIEIPLEQNSAGTYKYIRIVPNDVAGKIKFYIDSVYLNAFHIQGTFEGHFNALLGANTYIKSMRVYDAIFNLNANKKQGFVGFNGRPAISTYRSTYSDTLQCPENATTVVNPIYKTSPVPLSSGAITAAFSPGQLTIKSGSKTDIMIELSLSINKSFEWEDIIANGLWEPAKKEKIVDLGFRGMTAAVVNQ